MWIGSLLNEYKGNADKVCVISSEQRSVIFDIVHKCSGIEYLFPTNSQSPCEGSEEKTSVMLSLNWCCLTLFAREVPPGQARGCGFAKIHLARRFRDCPFVAKRDRSPSEAPPQFSCRPNFLNYSQQLERPNGQNNGGLSIEDASLRMH